jgi:hypothetical protein
MHMTSERDEQQAGGQANADQADEAPSEQVLRETREASMRAEGGGSSDEDSIREAAQQDGGG